MLHALTSRRRAVSDYDVIRINSMLAVYVRRCCAFYGYSMFSMPSMFSSIPIIHINCTIISVIYCFTLFTYSFVAFG